MRPRRRRVVAAGAVRVGRGRARRHDGTTAVGVEAVGKHLFYRFAPDGGPAVRTLHVHLGLFGRFRQYGADPAWELGGRDIFACPRCQSA